MFIPSNRLRRVETPDAPTPGVVPPVIPPVAPPGYTAAAAAPAAGPAAPAGPNKPMSKGLLIGLIAGGAALVVVAIIAVVALVLPSLLGGGGSNASTVIDITSEPEQTWDYDITGGNDEEFVDAYSTLSYAPTVGDNQVLITPSFDDSNYTEGDADWYEGYDDDYSDGYAAGEEYEDAYDAWLSDYTQGYDTLPEEDDYISDDSQGFSDGFYDATNYYDFGDNALEEPIDPDFTPSLALLDLGSGKEVWNVDLSDVFEDISFDSYVTASDIEGSNAVLVSFSTLNDDDEYVSVVATLNKANGEVISSVSDERTFRIGAYQGDVILGVSNKDGDEVTVGRYSVDALDEDPKWEFDADLGGSSAPYVSGDYVFVESDKGGVTIDARNGEEAKFGDDLDEASYFFLGGQLVRVESTDDGYEIDGYNLDGKSVWDDSIEAEWYTVADGDTLFVAEYNDTYSELMRINPSNGTEAWGDTYGEDFSSFSGVVGGNVVLRSEDYEDVLLVDLNSGEEKVTEGVDESSGIVLGENQFYEVKSDELIAYGYDGEGDRWKFDVDEDSEYVSQLGRHLVVIDTDKFTVNGLAAK